MTTSTTHIGGFRLNVRALTFWLIIICLAGIAGLGWLVMKKPLVYALALLAVPVGVWIVTHPRIAIVQYIAALFLPMPLLPSVPVFLVDVSALLVVAAALLDLFADDRLPVRLPKFTFNYLYILAAFVLCGALSYWPHIAPLRIVTFMFLIVVFVSFYRLTRHLSVYSMLRAFLACAFLLSLQTVIPFILSGGTFRSFGISGIIFDDLTLTALPLGVVLFLWAPRGKAWRYLIVTVTVLLALLATQSRLSILFGLTASAFAVVLSFRLAGRHRTQSPICREVRRRILLLVAPTVSLATVALFTLDVFGDLTARFAQLWQTSIEADSSRYRVTLWKRALQAFWDNPVAGVGPGGYFRLKELYPTMHLTEFYRILRFSKAHNVFLHYLAELGLIGGLGLVALCANTVRLAHQNLTRAGIPRLETVALLTWAFLFVLTVAIEAGWMWGQLSFLMVFFAALIARQHRLLEAEESAKQ